MNKYKTFSAVKDRKRDKKCSNKRRYDTEQDAYQNGQLIYYCNICGGYHRSGSLIATVRGYYR